MATFMTFNAVYGQADTAKAVNQVVQLKQWELDRYQQMKNDWANLECFRDENSKLGEAASGEKRVVFMGNSITEGWKNIRPEFFSGRPYINRGISGQTTPQMLIRFRPDVINLKPGVVVILAGTNDIAGNTGPSTLEMIEDNIKSMVDIAKGSIQITNYCFWLRPVYEKVSSSRKGYNIGFIGCRRFIFREKEVYSAISVFLSMDRWMIIP